MNHFLRRILGTAVLAALAAVAVESFLTSQPAASAPPTLGAAKTVETTPASPPGPGAEGDAHGAIRDLDTRIKALREEYHTQLDPLEAQVKALREKFDPEIKTLTDQRRQLVESSESPEVRTLDQQEDGELAALSEREKSDLDKVRSDFEAQRKAVRQKYAERRKELATKK